MTFNSASKSVQNLHWSAKYVGIPYAPVGRTPAGSDCWGLACLVYDEEKSIVLPSYCEGYEDPDSMAEVNALIKGDGCVPPFTRFTADHTPAQFDIAVFRRGRFDTHVGIVIKPGLMLHLEAEDQAKLCNYYSGVWSRRISGYLRHEGLEQ